MTTLSDQLPGWFKRKAATDATAGESDSETASTTTGGGSDQEPVVVWEAANVMEAYVVKGRLESEDIPAFIRGEALGRIYGLMAGSLASVEVLVPAPLADKAFSILFDDGDEQEQNEYEEAPEESPEELD